MRKMKKIFLITFFTVVSIDSTDKLENTTTISICRPPHEVNDEVMEVDQSYDDFLNSLGHRESGNDYNSVNSFGYLGRYQFGLTTLEYLEYEGTADEFLRNPELQDEFMYKSLLLRKRILDEYINRYDSTEYDGVIITESGILAAAHLAGSTGVKRFFDKQQNKQDAYGTSIADYLTEFSGYELNLN